MMKTWEGEMKHGKRRRRSRAGGEETADRKRVRRDVQAEQEKRNYRI